MDCIFKLCSILRKCSICGAKLFMFLWQKRAQVEQQIWTFVKYTGRALPVLMVSITQLQNLFVKIHVICAGKICVVSWVEGACNNELSRVGRQIDLKNCCALCGCIFFCVACVPIVQIR